MTRRALFTQHDMMRVVGSSARTHLDECSQELNPLTKFHSSEYDTSLERCLRPEKRPCDGKERWQGQKQYGLHHLTMNLQVHESDQLSLPVRQVASLDMVPERTPCPPACTVYKILGYRC